MYLFSLVASAVTRYNAAVINNQRQLNLLVLIIKIAFVILLKPGGSSVKDPSVGLVFTIHI